MTENNVKPTIKISVTNWNRENYGISNFYEISAYIEASGMNFDDACDELGMDSNQKHLLKLAYSKKYFEQHMQIAGEMYFTSAKKDYKGWYYGRPLDARNDIEQNKHLYLKKTIPQKQIKFIPLKKEQ